MKGHYFFENWQTAQTGAAPGRLRAVIPYEKNGQDESLEMDARFRSVNGLWLLDKVESRFRGGGSSTGVVTVVSAGADSYSPIRELLQKAEMTDRILTAVEASPEAGSEIRLSPGEWSMAPVKAAWTDKALESARGEDKTTPTPPIIGIHRARLVQSPEAAPAIELEGISTASWKEFLVEWKASVRDDAGKSLSIAATNMVVRAEGAPAAFLTRLELPPAAPPAHVFVNGTVQRMTGGYHGHGIWFRLTGD